MSIHKDVLFHLCCEIIDCYTHGLYHSRSGISYRATKRKYGVRILVRMRNKVNNKYLFVSKFIIKDKSDLDLFERVSQGFHKAMDGFH